jgi:hypothetical protein
VKSLEDDRLHWPTWPLQKPWARRHRFFCDIRSCFSLSTMLATNLHYGETRQYAVPLMALAAGITGLFISSFALDGQSSSSDRHMLTEVSSVNTKDSIGLAMCAAIALALSVVTPLSCAATSGRLAAHSHHSRLMYELPSVLFPSISYVSATRLALTGKLNILVLFGKEQRRPLCGSPYLSHPGCI